MTAPHAFSQARPDIHLHIERLVLDGLPLAPAEVPRFQAALEQELGRRLAAASAPGWPGGAVARLDAGAVHLAAGGSARTWGRQVAQTLAASLAAPPERAARETGAPEGK
jgi:hypothetical protein